MIRAKFTVNSMETTLITRLEDGEWKPCPIYTVKLSAVNGQKENSENKKFWEASPNGQISLSMIKKDVAEKLELGKEYYIDFTPADK
jgi:hypothetical protein